MNKGQGGGEMLGRGGGLGNMVLSLISDSNKLCRGPLLLNALPKFRTFTEVSSVSRVKSCHMHFRTWV